MTEEMDNDVQKFEERHKEHLPEKVPVDEKSNFFAMIERLASRPDIDVAKIEQIIKIEERILDRNAEQAFNAAMTQAQNKIELVVAKSENKQTNSNYADLKTVLLSAKPVYTAEGFSLMFYEGEKAKENHIRVCVDVMHEQGHTKQRYADFAIQTMGIAGKTMMTQIHGEGSAFTYGRRYLTCMIFNIPTGDDDDGNAMEDIQFINEKQLSTIVDFINEKNVSEVKFLKYMGVESLEMIPANKYKIGIASLKIAKGEKKEERQPGED